MAVTDHWKSASSELLLKGQGSSMLSYVGLGGSSLNVTANPVTGEISGAGYSRIPISWTDFSDTMTNEGTVIWQVGGTWSDVKYVFVSDSSQGGQILFYSPADFTTSDGDVISIAIGDLVLT